MIVQSEYAPAGYVIVDDAPDRRDKSSADRARERRLDRVGYAAMLRTTFGGDVAAFEKAQAFRFPKSLGRRLPLGGGWSVGETIYSRSAVAAWKADVLGFAKSLR